MLNTLLVFQIIIAVAMIVVILLQRSSADGMAGFSGGQSSGDSLLSGRASANVLTKTTAILAFCFILNSLVMATMIARSDSFSERLSSRIAEQAEQSGEEAEKSTPNVPLAD
jgi:preprotein translocase subunit SecG